MHTIVYADTTFIGAANDADAVVGVYSYENCCSGDQREGPFLNGALLTDLLPSGTALKLLTATGLSDDHHIVGQAHGAQDVTVFEISLNPSLGSCLPTLRRPSCK